MAGADDLRLELLGTLQGFDPLGDAAVAACHGQPVTPGGLGFVEAGLTATLALAGVGAAAAILATLAYRLVSYWLPLPVGLAAYVAHRRRLAGA